MNFHIEIKYFNILSIYSSGLFRNKDYSNKLLVCNIVFRLKKKG